MGYKTDPVEKHMKKKLSMPHDPVLWTN